MSITGSNLQKMREISEIFIRKELEILKEILKYMFICKEDDICKRHLIEEMNFEHYS